MKRILLFGAMFSFAALSGCSGEETTKDSGDTGEVGDDDDDDDTTGCTTTYSGPVIVQQATVTCDANDNVRYYVLTDGWTSDGIINASDTANNSFWDDEHDILSYEFDDCGFEDNLERELTTGADIGTWASNTSTVFTCANHFDDANGVMTYSARVYDIDQNFADCLAWGHDPAGWTAGDYWADCINCPTDQAEIASCVSARRAR